MIKCTVELVKNYGADATGASTEKTASTRVDVPVAMVTSIANALRECLFPDAPSVGSNFAIHLARCSSTPSNLATVSAYATAGEPIDVRPVVSAMLFYSPPSVHVHAYKQDANGRYVAGRDAHLPNESVAAFELFFAAVDRALADGDNGGVMNAASVLCASLQAPANVRGLRDLRMT
jgi:hypothetical protein